MAESVVSFAVEKIGNLLIDEVKFLRGVKGKVDDLYSALRRVQALLRDVDARRERKKAVEECVAQLRDFAYDAEDVIERYYLKAALTEGQNIIKAYACFMAKCSCVQVHEVGTEIESLKSRISEIGDEMQKYGIQPLNESECETARASTPERTYAHFEEEDFVGREDHIKVLVNELLKDGEQQRVISICGMGGLGKTTLAKKVFAHEKVKKHFHGFAWACISQEYRVRDILEGILVKLNPDQREGVKEMKDDDLLETLYKTQKEKRCIVVLDDIWTERAWVGLRNAFPTKDTRSKLLITTRNREVAQHIDPHCFLNEPQFLSQEESWNLLKKKVFPQTKGLVVEISSDGPRVGQDIVAGQVVEDIAKQSETEGQIPVITEDMKMLAYKLLKKCAGLPLAVVVLGGLLAHNDWETVHKTINLHFNDKRNVSEVLALSYDNLPSHLKPCFLYLGSFPEDAEIHAKEVLYMWIAEGFVSLNANNKARGISVEDLAEQYVMEFVNRGMVQVRFNLIGKIKSFHLHDLMRDLCISKALEESFLSILNIQQDNETENCSTSMAIKVGSSCKIRRLSLNRNVIPSLKASRRTLVHLRTLMSFGGVKWESKQFQPIFNYCKFLRVLKLENLNVKRSLPKSMGDLVHLRFLSLAGSDFNSLPQSMGNVVCMEFLDLVVTRYITVSIPNVLWKMRRLRYLHLPHKFAIKEKILWDRKKLRLGTLKNLRTLKNFDLKKCDVNDIDKFTNLQKLTVLDKYGCVKLEMFPQLVEFNLKHLRFLSLYLQYNLWTEGELSKMSNYPHSCKLFINGRIEKLPEHKSLPQQLRKLILIDSQLKEDPMPILEKLPHLVFLMLGYYAFMGKEMVCSAGGFPQLKHLLFDALLDLEEWRAAEGAVPHLSRLGIYLCPNLRVVVPPRISTYDGYDESLKELGKCGLF
ncbi:probable disease resistance RPP8-like protein 2 [Eucalyptus grandis]|uniref:probable disease resistance RPP8-like protein 2 n=1 Tax=Eucalyptus grandis TaxID=71139 RepID=UPI00192EA3FF|nr:probable disease resistance RPP8-like protein 2 [Eucalyptus grandis]